MANFSGTPTSGTQPLAVSFTDSSTNSPTAWSWTFGDSNSSTVQNPSHTYSAAGTFTVALTATNQYGNNTCTKSSYITVSAANTVVVYASSVNAYGGFTYASGTLPTSVQASDSDYYVVHNPGNNGDLILNYSTGLTPAQVTRITLEYQLHSSSATTPNSLVTIWNTSWTAGPYTASHIPGTSDSWYTLDVTSNASSYIFADGSIKGSNCCCAEGSSAFDFSINVARATIYTVAPPVANFSGTPTSGAPPLAVTFTDSSTNTPTVWSWNFGDSSTSTAANPSHTYNANGSYTVALTATNAGGNNTCTKTNYITVAPPAPVASFTSTPPTSGVAPLTVSFTDTSTNTPTAWSWNFGDGGTSTAQNPSHTYSSPGTYTVALTATNAGGNNISTTRPGSLSGAARAASRWRLRATIPSRASWFPER